MKNPALRRSLALMSAFPLGVALQAQTTPATEATADATSTDADVVLLDPFTVTTEHEGYKAVDTLAGSRVRTDLRDTPSALSVVTSKLMQDLGVTNAESLLVYTNNTEVAGLSGNFSGVSSRGTGVALAGPAENNRLTKPGEVNRSRGLTAMDSTRNYFPSDIPWDGYNVSRVDISRGPNSFLFGVGSPSGISNASTNEAAFADKGSIEAHYGSFGSTRESLDLNKQLIPGELALRVDLVNDDKRYRQEPAFSHSKRAYGALRFDPKFLKTDSAYTKFQASFEHGTVKSNNPRTLPPVDYLTGYLNDPAASTTGYDPWQYTMDTNISVDPRKSLWAASGSVGNQYQWGNGPQLYWDAHSGALLSAGAASSTSPTGAGYGATSNTYNVHSQGYSGYAKAANYLWRQSHGNNEDDAPFKGAYRGTVKYYDETLDDPSVFDFYNHLIDGDNKREWQRWNAYNVNLVQSLFDERLVVQAVLDREEYHRGDEGLLSARTPTIMLDLNSYNLNANPSWLPGAKTNANVGRPLVFGDQGTRNTTDITRDNYQITTVYNLNFERDFSSKGLWASILGRHDFTALGSRNERSEEGRSYRVNGVDYSYHLLTGNNLNARAVDNNYNWLAYMGPSVLGSSGVRTGLSGLEQSLTPASLNSYSYYSKQWTAGASVNPTDPWTYTGKDGSSVTQIQADNPANYQSYTGINIPTVYGGSDVLGTGGSKSYQKISSLALLYQGHFWDDTIVPTFGYRKDTTMQRGNNPTTANGYIDSKTGIVNYNYDITDEGVESTTISRSYGVAVHLPKAIRKNLPEGTDLTFYYFHGANETPKVRYGLDGSQLPNETGETDDYSVQYDGFKGRFTARLTYFKTVNKNAFASVGQPLGTSMVKSLPEWTLLLHAYSMTHQSIPKDQNGYFMVPSTWDSWTKRRLGKLALRLDGRSSD
ncbi:MAG: TonB-dependent receptor plug domain-containing protein [Opitutaceae bacterium]|nr:TonB-dependent receptor plug domain-containing protein [Opitutaceae bacterium]